MGLNNINKECKRIDFEKVPVVSAWLEDVKAHLLTLREEVCVTPEEQCYIYQEIMTEAARHKKEIEGECWEACQESLGDML